MGVVDDVHSEPVALRLLRRLVLLAGLLAGLFLAGLVLAGPAHAASGEGGSSDGGHSTGTTRSVVHAVIGTTSAKTTSATATPTKASTAKPAAAKTTSTKATSVKATAAKATSAKATSAKATSATASPTTPSTAKPVVAKATSVKPTSVKATAAKAISATATSTKATPVTAVAGDTASGPLRRVAAGTSATAVRMTSPVAAPRPRVVDPDAVVPHLAPLDTTVDRATTAAAIPALASSAGSIVDRASTLPIDLGTALSTSGLRTVLAPVTTVTSTVAHAEPAVSALLAPVVALPRTLTQPAGLIGRTGGLLVDTVTGLTGTTTALTRTVGELGEDVLGVPRGALGGLAVLNGIVGTAGPTPPPDVTLALAPGTTADRLPAATTPGPPLLLPTGPAHDPLSGEVASTRPTGPGSAGAASLTVDAAAGPGSQPGRPGAPAPWDPVAPAAPAGTAGASTGAGASVPTGMMGDPLALPAILIGLVLVACGRRSSWWFPEVAIGPD